MLYDGLFALDLPSSLGPPVRTGRLEALENLLFRGQARQCHAECSMSAAGALSRTYGALRAFGCRAFTVGCDADELLELCITSRDEPRWPEVLPPDWTDLPADFFIRGSCRGRGLVGVVHARYTPRHLPPATALSGSLRLLWDVRPRSGEEEHFAEDLGASLADGLRPLRHSLEACGRAQADRLLSILRSRFDDAPGDCQGDVLLLHGHDAHPRSYASMLTGFPPECLAQLPLLEQEAKDMPERWLAIDATGVRGRLCRGRFTPVEEASHAA